MPGRTFPLIKVATHSFSKNEYLRTELLKYFPGAALNTNGKRLQRQTLKEFLKDAQGAIIGLEPITADTLRSCPSLEIISKFGVGLDNIDQKACQKHGIALRCTEGVNRRSVAELTLGFMLALCRNFYRTSIGLKHGLWIKEGGYELSGKTVGIIGAGRIGKDVIGLLKGFHCRILVNDIIDQSAYYRKHGLIHVSKKEIFKKADVITLHAPLTGKTRHMINAGAMALMKKTAFLINTARGPIVDQGALKNALKRGMIGGAALDVYETEPPGDRELVGLGNLICTPHIGGNSSEAVRAMGLAAIGHLKKFFKAV